ncbi:putative galactose oxidase/kelch, beta-propeller, galactose oxidase, beta-propeller [Rosa chinensis]|uniref:Putative galactose oxidase/kelch, beta-propeller, galactose oxidase, beta-propeller n=1 Tax=Rosa chinensis TaxID=74649 RepID=A0A2P6QNC5_ROSCH|nr:putative galactose oxidase/kelch, beta-propeller, galactose oxidase, beta-propeller [Rosa chinensis]
MSTAMVPFIGVVHDGMWFLKGLGSHREVMSEAYSPEANTWNPISDGMVAGWRNPSISLNGQLYALDCRDGCKVRVYDRVTDSWNKFIDSKLHLGSSRALEAAALVPLNVESNPSLWENIAGKGHFRTLVSNLWSSIAGRTGLKSHYTLSSAPSMTTGIHVASACGNVGGKT